MHYSVMHYRVMCYKAKQCNTKECITVLCFTELCVAKRSNAIIQRNALPCYLLQSKAMQYKGMHYSKSWWNDCCFLTFFLSCYAFFIVSRQRWTCVSRSEQNSIMWLFKWNIFGNMLARHCYLFLEFYRMKFLISKACDHWNETSLAVRS